MTHLELIYTFHTVATLEIVSMRKTLLIFRQGVVQCMAHQLCAKVQFGAIEKIYSERSTQKALLVIDHKE
jgi:hypothetical protein